MKVNGRDKPWLGQYDMRRTSLRRIGWRQVEQTTRTGAGPDGAPAGFSSSLPSRPDAGARESRAWIRGERDEDRVGPACNGPTGRGRFGESARARFVGPKRLRSVLARPSKATGSFAWNGGVTRSPPMPFQAAESCSRANPTGQVRFGRSGSIFGQVLSDTYCKTVRAQFPTKPPSEGRVDPHEPRGARAALLRGSRRRSPLRRWCGAGRSSRESY